MKMNYNINKKLLREILESITPSGNEESLVKLWMRELKDVANVLYADAIGSAHAILNNTAQRKVVINAHCDEIGFIIKSISDEGFLKIAPLGGWDAQVAVGQRVKILSDNGIVFGVIGKKPLHQIEDFKVATKTKELFVDIGAKNKTDAARMVSIGDSMVLDQGFVELCNGLFSSRGCDDKVGFFIILEVLKELAKEHLDVAVEGIASVQEEVGTRGVQSAAYLANADIAFVVDINFANDHPCAEKDTDIRLGRGPILERGPHVNKKLFRLLRSTAELNEIQYQLNATGRAFGTDTEVLQKSRGGLASALVSIPCRYAHSPSETCSYKDIEAIINLLIASIKAINNDTDVNFI